jgi:hypothetical protein
MAEMVKMCLVSQLPQSEFATRAFGIRITCKTCRRLLIIKARYLFLLDNCHPPRISKLFAVGSRNVCRRFDERKCGCTHHSTRRIPRDIWRNLLSIRVYVWPSAHRFASTPLTPNRKAICARFAKDDSKFGTFLSQFQFRSCQNRCQNRFLKSLIKFKL